MQGVQKRPLTGMGSGGVSAPRLLAVTPGTLIHTLDATTDQLGGPFIDVVTLWVNNPTAAAVDLTLTVAGGTAMVVSIAAKSTVKVLDEEAFQAAAGTTSTIVGFGGTAVLVFYGDFARPL